MRTYNRPINVKTKTGGSATKSGTNLAPVLQPAPQPVDILNTATAATTATPVASLMEQALHYQLDRWQRSVLFLDMLRERAENMLAHEEGGRHAAAARLRI